MNTIYILGNSTPRVATPFTNKYSVPWSSDLKKTFALWNSLNEFEQNMRPYQQFFAHWQQISQLFNSTQYIRGRWPGVSHARQSPPREVLINYVNKGQLTCRKFSRGSHFAKLVRCKLFLKVFLNCCSRFFIGIIRKICKYILKWMVGW